MEGKEKNTREMEEFEDIQIEDTAQTKTATDEKGDGAETKESKRKSRKERKKDASVDALKEEYNTLNDKYLRLFSEFDNFRKRTIKEKLELSKTAAEDVMIALISTLDDFERAMQAMEGNDDNKANLEGIKLIYNKLKKTLQQKGLEDMNAKGEVFDTDYHEALTNIPAPDPSMKGKVVDVIEKGYFLNGKVIRFAKVVVGN